ncbi:F-box/kelch-repeat protein At3g23880-like [Rhododendron vialii]|uniref:F-box/kelch-repeat protein At3g23880-like n=1 Tax=Rhododendron vialii TaxID=182163 RepID=UPI0026605BB4|nr:F-box/kelch-repeat protein At3g23880-like [Rhododendron vialii]
MGLIGRICSFFLVCSSSQTTKQTEDSQPVLLPNLPPEIIVEILSRLPVKPLLRLRCVCKSWRSLISHRQFAKTHLSLASSMGTFYTSHRLLIIGLSSGVTSCSLCSILKERSDIDVVELDYPLCGETRGVCGGVRILGCCDGLMCIQSKCTLFLWNPSTRKSKKLPSLNLPPAHVVLDGFGLGYDASIDDYKVVLMLKDRRSIGIALEVKVYTLRTDSWRRIGDFPHDRPYFRLHPGVFLNGALHWKLDTNRLIVSMDLAKETYGEFLEPEYQHGCSYEMLCAFSGCLCVLYHDYHRTCVDLWVLKEYGIRESWTKLVVVPYVTSPSYLKFAMPVCILKNGEVLLKTHKHLVRCNPKVGTFTYRPIPIDLAFSNVHLYVESLVSVDMDADGGVPWQHLY